MRTPRVTGLVCLACLALCAAAAGCAKTTELSGTDSTTHGPDGGAGIGGGSVQDGAVRDAGAGASTGAGGVPAGCEVPWYKCRDVCPSQFALEGGRRSFGECSGDCGFELRITPIIVLDEGNCDSVMVELTVHNTDGGLLIYSAVVTDEAWEQATLISIDLAAARAMIPAVTENGCFDCGTSDIAISGLDPLEQTFSYPYGGPPPELIDADAFVQGLIEELYACEGEHIIDCSSRRPGLADDVCRFEYTGESSTRATCVLAAATELPCREAARCLCEAGALTGGSDVDGCVDAWVIPRGGITFSDFCTQSPQPPIRNLAEALNGFASAHGHTVNSVTVGCEAAAGNY